jgi:phage terminase large subunit-like protein
VTDRVEQIRERLEALPPAALAVLRDKLAEKVQQKRYAQWQPYPWQVCPDVVPAMGSFALFGGRGTGKTDMGSRYVLDHINGTACDSRVPGGHRIGIISPTLGDAVEAAVNGPSGLRTHDPRTRVVSGVGGTHVKFHNGAQGKLFGAHTKADVERLRAGGGRCLYWCDELAAMRYAEEVMAHSAMGLRLGSRPHYVLTSTPKPRAVIIKIANDPKTLLTKGRTMDAWHLPPETRQALWDEYGGTNLGRQELEGEILGDTEGALVSRATLDAGRVPEAPELNLIVVGVDPNGSGTKDEFGIVAIGRAADGEAYVLADSSTRVTGRDAALKAWALFDDIDADVLVCEDNFGKSYLHAVMADAWKESHEGEPPIKYVHAGTGKTLRAQPMAMRFEQKRLHIVGVLDQLEAQLATWVPSESTDSPDRIDAAAHAFAYVRGREKQRAKISLPHNLGSLR